LSVYFNQATRRNNPEDSPLHIRHRENLKTEINVTFSTYIVQEKRYDKIVNPTAEISKRQHKVYSGEISISHGGEYEDGCLLGCCEAQSGRN
jgi:hypothetical protein